MNEEEAVRQTKNSIMCMSYSSVYDVLERMVRTLGIDVIRHALNHIDDNNHFGSGTWTNEWLNMDWGDPEQVLQGGKDV